MGSSVDKPARRDDGFPTPTSLLAAQLHYSKSKKAPRKNNGEVPEPFPPLTLKAEVYNVADYAHVDAHAGKAPLRLAAKSYEALAEYLVEPTTNDIGRARSFFVWIASQRLQHIVDFVDNTIPPEDSPLYTVLLMLLKQWGNGYSELFSKLCQAVNIPCRVVKGKVKGSGYRLGDVVEGTNDYCMVYVDQNWRFVDPHWGSQFVISSVDNNGDWEMIRPDSPTTAEANKNDAQQEQIGYNCDDFYFLTDPVAMVYTHLTCNPSLQLLARPVSEEEFRQMAYLKDSFFELGMTSVSHPKCLVESDNTGTVVFEFGLDPSKQCSFTTELYKSAQDPALNTVEGFSFDQFSTLENLQDKLRVTISFPRIGRYKFELDGKEIGSIEGFTSICEYSIYCSKPNFRFDPNPENSRGEWGPGADTARYGLEPDGKDGGIIYAQDGRAIVAFRSNDPKRIRFRYTLKSFEQPSEDLRECICFYKNGELIIFLMKLPHEGKYTLEMYAKICDRVRKKKRGSQKQKNASKSKSKSREKDKKKEKNQKNSKESKTKKQQAMSDDDDDESMYESICNYLIKSDVGCYDLAPYPPLDNVYGQTGDVTELNEDDLCLTPDSHAESVIDPYELGQMTIVLHANKQPTTELRAEMTRYYHNDDDDGDEDSSNYVMMYRDELKYTLDLHFPKVGFYKLSLTSGDTLVHQYLINVIEPDTDCGPYPTRGPGWRDEFQLLGTKTAYLEADRRFLLRLRAAGVSNVRAVFDDGKQVEYTQQNNDEWETEVHTDPRGGGQLRVLMDDQRSAGMDVLLMTYKILDGDQLTKMKTEQQMAVQDADEHRREMNEKREAEEREAERRRREEEEAARRAEEDFRKNRQKYETEEALITARVEEEEMAEAEEQQQSSDEMPVLDLQPLQSDSEKRNDKEKKKTPKEDYSMYTRRSEETTPRKHHQVQGSDDTADWHHYHPKPSPVEQTNEVAKQPTTKDSKDATTQANQHEATVTSSTQTDERPVEQITSEPTTTIEKEMSDATQQTEEQQQVVLITPLKKKKARKVEEPEEKKPPASDEEKPVRKKKKHKNEKEESETTEEQQKPRHEKKQKSSSAAAVSEEPAASSGNDETKRKKKKKKKKKQDSEDEKSELMKSMKSINKQELSQQMALEKLRESMRCRQHTMLKIAIDDCERFDKLRDNKEVRNANRTLAVIEARQALQRACDNKDAKEIRREVDKIREAGLTKYLQNETREAMYLVELLERMPANKNVLDMGRKLMTEIRRYQCPPTAMHRIMQSALLLLGEDEDTTDSWKTCQRLCNPQGNHGLNRRMFEFQPDRVHPEIVARSKEMLLDIDIAKVQAVGPAAITFYVWVRGSIEEAEELQEDNGGNDEEQDSVKPASRDRQKELFGRQPPQPKAPRSRHMDTSPYESRQHSQGHDSYDYY